MVSLLPGSIAMNENGEIGIIQYSENSQYIGINLSRYGSVTSKGFNGDDFTYTGGALWNAREVNFLCYIDDLKLLGEKMYGNEKVPFEMPSAHDIKDSICFCSNPILGVATSNEQGNTDMGEDRWPGFHLTTGEVLKKNFKGKDIDYTFTAGGPWSSSKPRPIVKISDLPKLASTIRTWASLELDCVCV